MTFKKLCKPQKRGFFNCMLQKQPRAAIVSVNKSFLGAKNMSIDQEDSKNCFISLNLKVAAIFTFWQFFNFPNFLTCSSATQKPVENCTRWGRETRDLHFCVLSGFFKTSFLNCYWFKMDILKTPKKSNIALILPNVLSCLEAPFVLV